MKKTDSNYFEIPESLRSVFESLTDIEAGLLLTALMGYHFDGKEPDGLPAWIDGMYRVLKVVTANDFKA